MVCPKCQSQVVNIQAIQTGSIGAAQNTVYVQPAKRSKGCLYWCVIGWWFEPFWFLLVGWWWKLFVSGRVKKGINFSANKVINKRVAICQNCGYQWYL